MYGRIFNSISLAAITLTLVSVPSQGQDGAHRLPDLIAEVLRESPEILAAQKRYEAARQRPAQASALDETMLSAGYSSAGRPLPFAGIGREPTSNVGFMLTQEFPFPGKRQIRGEIAYKEADEKAAGLKLKEVQKAVDKKYKIAKIAIDEPIRSTPVVANGILYVMTERTLYAIQKK